MMDAKTQRPPFSPADILLPVGSPEKWAVIACDQYTSEPEYWHTAEQTVGDAPSALRVIFPEVYLSDPAHDAERICQINATMHAYLGGGVLRTLPNTMIYTCRTVTGGAVRHGLIGQIDLTDYAYQKGSRTLIRATEQTVAERIPPRVQIRRDAPMELPHVMLLIDDPADTVFGPLAAETAASAPLYDFDLMQHGGHLTGRALPAAAVARVQAALSALAAGQADPLLFAVGDGNHSLAAAKECYLADPTEEKRYALVEVVNIHDPSLVFEPIYRVVFGVQPDELIADFIAACGECAPDAPEAQRFTAVSGGQERSFAVRPASKLAVGTLQAFLDRWLAAHPSASIDYIHGEESVRRLAAREDAVGFLFSGMRKDELFAAVRQDGSLPRKTFSMGHADDKRFYLEARRLISE